MFENWNFPWERAEYYTLLNAVVVVVVVLVGIVSCWNNSSFNQAKEIFPHIMYSVREPDACFHLFSKKCFFSAKDTWTSHITWKGSVKQKVFLYVKHVPLISVSVCRWHLFHQRRKYEIIMSVYLTFKVNVVSQKRMMIMNTCVLAVFHVAFNYID